MKQQFVIRILMLIATWLCEDEKIKDELKVLATALQVDREIYNKTLYPPRLGKEVGSE